MSAHASMATAPARNLRGAAAADQIARRPAQLDVLLRVQPVPAGRRTRFSSRWSRRKLPSVPAAVSNVDCGSPAGCAVSGAHHLLTSRNLVKQISRSNWMREKPQRTVMLSRDSA
jgi:hypothetical protein